jgi:hypothetical protein
MTVTRIGTDTIRPTKPTVISLQRDFDHVLIAEPDMQKRVGNELGDDELSIGHDGLAKIIDRPHP